MEIRKAAGGIAIAFVIFTLLLVPLRDGFTDDGFIHIQYAKNIIQRGEYSFNPGVVSFGTTSPLWVLVQAVMGLLFGGPDILMKTSRILSWMSGFASLVAVFALTWKLSRQFLLSMLAVLALACDAWFVRWTAMSMETSSAVLAILLAALVSLDAHEEKKSAMLLGFLLAIAALLRPEAYLFFPVYILSLFLRGGKVDSRCAARTIVVFALLILPWLLFARIHLGTLLPNTAGAKSGGIILNPITFVKKFYPIVKIIGSSGFIWVLFMVLSLVLKRKKSFLLSYKAMFLLLMIISLPLAYVFLDMQVLSRYLLLITPLIAVLGIISSFEVLSTFDIGRRKSKVLVCTFAVAMITVSVSFYYTVVLKPSSRFARDLTHQLRDVALYLRNNSPENAVVAAADIGYLAFFSQRKVLDLGGLVEPATGELRSRFTYEEIVEKGMYLDLADYPRVDYFIDRERSPNRFNGKVINGYKFKSILVKIVDNLGIRKPGPYYYTLYKILPQN